MTFYNDACTAPCAPARRRVSLFDLFAVARQRRHLARLDDRALADIGLSRTEARNEAKRPLWDVPGHWLK